MFAPRAHVRLLPLALALACADHKGDKNLTNPTTAGDGFLGSAIITVAPGTGVLEGMDPGTGPAAIADGWTVRFDKFVVAIGDFAGDDLTDPGVHVVDLFSLPDPSYIFATIDRVPPRVVESVALRLSVPTEDATSIEDFSVDRDFMIKNGWSLFVSGTLTNPAGQSCLPDDPADCVTTEKIAFELGLGAGVALTDCATLTGEGFTILENDSVEVPIVLRGDRLFAVDFSGNSGELRAQWLADADIDRDGTATADELVKIAATDLFGPEYDLTAGAPRPIDSAYDFFLAQALAGVGYRGDGTCTVRVEQ
jgi:hypothetical protein